MRRQVERRERAGEAERQPGKPRPRAAPIDEPSRKGAEPPAASANAPTAKPPSGNERVERSTARRTVSETMPNESDAAESA